MADKAEVKKQLDEIEAARKSGMAVKPPIFGRGNILGQKTRAFKEAVKEQGKIIAAEKAKGSYTQSGELFDLAAKAKKQRLK